MRHSTSPQALSQRDEGHILVLTGMLLAPLLVFAAFATDVGAWVTTASRMQRAADAAALAGAAELPDTTKAIAIADEVMRRNGYAAGVDSMNVAISATLDDGVTVDVSDADPPMFFAGLVLNSLTINRRAVAEQRAPLSLGSPENFLGNDPTLGQTPNYWLMAFGPETSKESGDRYHTKRCRNSTNAGCGAGDANDEYDPDGYFYEAEVRSVSGGEPLRFEMFDPTHHNVGDFCNAGWLFDPGQASSQGWYAANTANLADFAPERYEKGTHEWCTGDNGLTGPMRTTVLIREPDDTPSINTDNEVVCAMEFASDVPTDQADFAQRLTSNATATFPRWVDSGATLQSAPTSLTFREYFRSWVTICDVANPVPGNYLMQIRTNADRSNSPNSLVSEDASILTKGRNRFALRVGWGDDPTDAQWNDNLSLGARERLPIYINAATGTTGTTLTEFTLVRATNAFAGEQIVVDFYDISDGKGDITLQIRAPQSFEASGGSITCSFTKAGAPKPEVSECAISEPPSAGDSLVYQATINVPAGYDCNENDAFDCWFRAEMTFAAAPSDSTTWSAYAPGKPTRLSQ